MFYHAPEVQFSVTKKFKKDFRKLSHETQTFIRHKVFPAILNNPHKGKNLKGKKYTELSKLSLKFKSTDYRIIYRIEKNELIIILIMIASRENFYQKLKQQI